MEVGPELSQAVLSISLPVGNISKGRSSGKTHQFLRWSVKYLLGAGAAAVAHPVNTVLHLQENSHKSLGQLNKNANARFLINR